MSPTARVVRIFYQLMWFVEGGKSSRDDLLFAQYLLRKATKKVEALLEGTPA